MLNLILMSHGGMGMGMGTWTSSYSVVQLLNSLVNCVLRLDTWRANKNKSI